MQRGEKVQQMTKIQNLPSSLEPKLTAGPPIFFCIFRSLSVLAKTYVKTKKIVAGRPNAQTSLS